MKIYIISLVKAIERRKFQEEQLKKLGLKYIFFNAYSPDTIDLDFYKKHYSDWQRPLKKEEFGCYLSHRELWKKIITDNKPALILEDDILLSKYTKDMIEKLSTNTEFDLINFETGIRKKYVAKCSKKITETHNLVKLYLNRSGSGAYVLYPEAAKKLLKRELTKGIALADYHIHNCYSLKSYQAEPAIAVQMVFSEHYKIKKNNLIIAASSIYDGSRIKSNFRFILRRIFGQIRLGVRQLATLMLFKKRNITLQPSHFDF
ncbi:MAG: glycosyltransferase family 25 protein [Bdellovibrionales bacterium]|nr:glycosyltransferase family 25 protein [Bdellovibrionales bacterium]